MTRISVNGTELWYSDTGGDGQVVLFHHGYTGSHDTWPPIIERMPADYRYVMMDGRGAGDSAHPAEGYTVEQYTADVIGVADALEIDRFTYVGHSMGGAMGMLLALEFADRLDRLVLVSSVGSGGLSGTPPSYRANMRALWASKDAEELVRQRLATAARPELNDEVVTKEKVDRALSVSEGYYDGSWDSMAAFDVTDRMGDISTPTLVIAGAADFLIADNVHDYLRLPNASVHVFHRVGHFAPSDLPDEFAEVLTDFLIHGVVTAASLQARL